MKPIPLKSISKYWKEGQSLDQQAIFQRTKYLYIKQPFVMENIMLSEDGELTKDELQILYFLGCFVVRVMLQENPAINQVKLEDMKPIEDRNMALIERFSAWNSPEEANEHMEEIIMPHNQRDLIGFIWVGLIKEMEPKDPGAFRNMVLMFLYLKMMLEALDEAEVCYN